MIEWRVTRHLLFRRRNLCSPFARSPQASAFCDWAGTLFLRCVFQRFEQPDGKSVKRAKKFLNTICVQQLASSHVAVFHWLYFTDLYFTDSFDVEILNIDRWLQAGKKQAGTETAVGAVSCSG